MKKDLPIFDIILNDDDQEKGVSMISLVDSPAIGVDWVYLMNQEPLDEFIEMSFSLTDDGFCLGCPPNGDGRRKDGEPDKRCSDGSSSVKTPKTPKAPKDSGIGKSKGDPSDVSNINDKNPFSDMPKGLTHAEKMDWISKRKKALKESGWKRKDGGKGKIIPEDDRDPSIKGPAWNNGKPIKDKNGHWI